MRAMQGRPGGFAHKRASAALHRLPMERPLLRVASCIHPFCVQTHLSLPTEIGSKAGAGSVVHSEVVRVRVVIPAQAGKRAACGEVSSQRSGPPAFETVGFARCRGLPGGSQTRPDRPHDTKAVA